MTTASRLLLILTLLPAAAPACIDGEADLTVVNGTAGTWVGLWVREAHSSDSWGTNHILGKSLEPGLAFTVRDIPDRDRYEVQAEDDDGFVYQSDSIRISFDDESITLSDADLVAGDARLVVDNRTGMTWTALYVRERGAAEWGASRLAAPVPGAGSAGVLVPVRERYEVRAEAETAAAWEVETDFVQTRELTLTVTADDQIKLGRLRVVNGIDFGNGGDNSIIAVFIAEAGSGTWSADLLQDSIPNDGVRDFEVHPGAWDVKVVDVAGNTYQRSSDPVTAGFSAEVIFLVSDQVASP